MNREILEVKLEEDVLAYIEQLFFEKTALKEINLEILRSADKFPYSKDMYDHQNQKFLEKNNEFELAMKMIPAMFLPEEQISDNLTTTINFSKGTATISIQEGGHSCSQCQSHIK